ncbi:MAG: lipopolysaccharide kinase InaA family protein [Planctomycetota bacterium]
MSPSAESERCAGGRLTLRVAGDVSRAAARDAARELAERGGRAAGPITLADGTDAWWKGAALSRSGARRHGLARLRGRPAPRLAEFAHLAWLDARLFRVPRPLFAAALTRRGSLLHQCLATERLAEAAPFEVAHARCDGEGALALASEFGRELGRMHALGFLHADVYARNVLVTPPRPERSDTRRLVWIDCWAGGPGHRDHPLALGKPLARDLGTWFAAAPLFWSDAEARAALEAYFGARRVNGRPVLAPRRCLSAVVRERRRELSRLERDPARLRGAPFPPAGWEPPSGSFPSHDTGAATG